METDTAPVFSPRPCQTGFSVMVRLDCPERVAELTPRRHAELWEQTVQVGSDRPVRQEQTVYDLALRQTGGRELGDLQLLR